MPKLSYFPASEEDVPVIVALSTGLVRRYEDLSSIDTDRVFAWIENKIRKNISKYTCVMEAGEKVGYFCLTRDGQEWELDDLYVLPDHRNMGIGSKILDHCISVAGGPIFLYVFTANTGAICLYERFGFVVTEQVSPTRQIMRREG